jgi:nucleoside-diphosphate-sugar epimerase
VKFAITGGTGFLGQALIRLLAGQAEEIRVLVRRPEDDARIRALGAEPIRGDLTVPGGCDGLVREGDVVFHAAARVDITGKWRLFQQTTIDGTQRLLNAALPRRPARFVHISSAGVYSQASADGRPASAELTPAVPAAYNFYARAKLEAERLVRTECDRAGCSWTISRPAFLYGPENRILVNSFARLLRQRQLLVIGPGTNRIAAAYVDDAARAAILAATDPKAHARIYDVASDEAVTQVEFLNAIAETLGMPGPSRHIPLRVARAAAFVADLIARLPGLEPPFSRAMIALMSTDQIIDTSRIRDDLGWKPEVTFAEGMRRMREWYLAGAGKDSQLA